MTADDFLWWWLGRRYGVTEESVRADPVIQRSVAEEADSRTHEVIDRVISELRRREQAVGCSHSGPDQQHPPPGDSPRPGPEPERTRAARRSSAAGLTVAEAAERLGCSLSKVYRLFDAGELRGHKVGDKRVVDPASVEEFIHRHANPQPNAVPSRTAEKSARGFRHLKLPS